MRTVLCYGDSNTYGAKPVGFDLLDKPVIISDLRYSRDNRWTGVLQKELGTEYFIIEEGLCGRTSSLDDPIEGYHKNGKGYLLPCLETNSPIDLVMVMLGTNDLKKRFSVSAYDIALSIASLICIIKNSQSGPEGKEPEILIMSPPPLGKLTIFSEMFEDSIEKSKKLSIYYKKVAKLLNCEFFDTGSVITSSIIDGIHFGIEEHKKLGKAASEVVKEIFK